MTRMRAWMFVFVLALLAGPAQAASQAHGERIANAAAVGQPGTSLVFVENVGQFPPEVRFYALGVGLWIGDDGVWRQEGGEGERGIEGVYVPLAPRPFNRLAERVHFYPSADPATWREDVPVWGGVQLADVYPGVDLELTGVDGGVAWQWDCTGACPADLPVLTASAAMPQAVTDNPGALIGGTFVGGSAYDGLTGLVLDDDGTVYVAGSTSSTDAGFTGPVFVAAYAPDLKTRRFVTFLGGDLEYDSIRDLARDAAGNLYVVGSTWSRQFPVTPGAFDTVLNDGRLDNCPTGNLQKPCPDAFAARFNAAGQLSYATYLGGAKMDIPGLGNQGGDDYGIGIRADAAGNIYVVGNTDSDDLPTTPGAYDRTFSYMDIGLNPDVFVVKLRPGGAGAADLVYSTYVGAGFINEAHGMALDAQGVAYVTGSVTGHDGLIPPEIDFPRTSGAYPNASECRAYYCQDVFFFKLRPGGQGSADMLYSTFFGGSSSSSVVSEMEWGADVALASNGAVVIVGAAASDDFPTTTGAFLTSYPVGASPAGFVARLNPAGQGTADLQYSTFLGGRYETRPLAVAVDADGQAYVTGITTSPDFPFTRGAFDSTLNGEDDAFLTHLALQGQGGADLKYSTFLGGHDDDVGNGLALAGTDAVHVAGRTYSTNLPLPDDGHDPTHNGGADGFIARLALGAANISGRLADENGAPLVGITVNAGTYTAVTNSQGQYAFTDLPAGIYTITPSREYFWEPAQRVVSVPPDATGHDFVGRNLVKTVTPSSYQGTLLMGTPITYTVALVFPDATARTFYDRIPTYTTYIPGTLVAPSGVVYDAGTRTVAGPLTIAPGTPLSVTFAVRVGIVGSVGFAPQIANRACVYPTGQTLDACVWSNEVRTFTYARQVFLPLVLR